MGETQGRRDRLLVVDDDAALRALLERYLSENGYDVVSVADGEAMERFFAKEDADLVILDLMLPGEDGLLLAQRLRGRGERPIIIVSARGEEVDRIVGLEIGADDYLAKPFNPRELLARVRAVLRRHRASCAADPSPAGRRFGSFVLDTGSRRLLRNGEEIPLTAGEYNLLLAFLDHPNRVLTRDALLEMLKGYERAPFDRSIDVRITRLRKKIEPDPAKPVHIRTIWGAGYLFSPAG